MWLTKRILVPTDFGESAKAASDIGLELAQRFQVPLVLMHTYGFRTPSYAGIPFVPTADYLQLVEHAARVALDREAQRLTGKGVAVSSVLKPGIPWEDILTSASQLDVGLVVMGTHGRRGLPRALLGSVAEKIVRLSHVPVLTVHGASKKEESET